MALPWVEQRSWPQAWGRIVSLRPALLAKVAGTSTVDLRLTSLQAMCWLVSCGIALSYALTKHWLLNNLVACCLCISGLEIVSVGSFRNGAILLGGLFVYDIYWVFFSKPLFGSNVMVSVAKGIDGPIKFLFVRDRQAGADPKFSMLGLGDVVVPGLFVALLLRYDARKANRDGSNGSILLGTFPAPYFHAAMAAYVFGLATTLGVMYAFDAAQPALLYLVPAVLGTALAVAAAAGDVASLAAYSEETTAGNDVQHQNAPSDPPLPDASPAAGPADATAATESLDRERRKAD